MVPDSQYMAVLPPATVIPNVPVRKTRATREEATLMRFLGLTAISIS
jgi:hypothetical protein